jgi:hypothetical protein
MKMKLLSAAIRAEFARAMRNFKYERTATGIYFPGARAKFGGILGYSENFGEWRYQHNVTALEGLDWMLNIIFNNAAAPSSISFAPFSNNVTPNDTITAATFAQTLGEYTAYAENQRQAWQSNGASIAQLVSNSNNVATITIGGAAVTLTGAGLIANATAKGATTGVAIAAALFPNINQLGPGSTFQMKYNFGATPAAD